MIFLCCTNEQVFEQISNHCGKFSAVYVPCSDHDVFLNLIGFYYRARNVIG